MTGGRNNSMELRLWKERLHPYELAVDELVMKLQFVIKEHMDCGVYCPIENVNGRVKSMSSILSKAERKGIPVDEVQDRIEDIAGIRIICQFEEDIYQVVEYLRSRTDMKVTSEVDYITHPKPSGYRSYHMVIEYQVQTSFESCTIPVEIQIRTLAMDFWAVIEHSLQYKYEQRIPDRIRRRLMSSAEAVISLDEEMMAIRDEIKEAQAAFHKKANLVQEIMNSLGVLSKTVSQETVLTLQDRFFKLYNQGKIEELKQLRDEVDLLCKMQLQEKLHL